MTIGNEPTNVTAMFPLIIAIATGIFTLIAVWFGGIIGKRQARETLKEQARLQERKAKLERIEELYELVSRWLKVAISDHIVFRSAMQGKVTYNEALDLITKKGRARFDSSRMVALAELYVPEKAEEFKKLNEADEVINTILWEFKEEYKKTGPESRDRSNELNVGLRKLNNSAEAFKAELVKLVQDV